MTSRSLHTSPLPGVTTDEKYEYELEKFHARLREKCNDAQKVMEMDSLDFLLYRYNKAAERLKDNAIYMTGGPKPEPATLAFVEASHLYNGNL